MAISISLLVMDLFIFLFLSFPSLVVCVCFYEFLNFFQITIFVGIYFLIILPDNYISAVLDVMSLLSFLILFIWVLSLFFLVSLARGLSILFMLSKNQLLVWLICSTGICCCCCCCYIVYFFSRLCYFPSSANSRLY